MKNWKFYNFWYRYFKIFQIPQTVLNSILFPNISMVLNFSKFSQLSKYSGKLKLKNVCKSRKIIIPKSRISPIPNPQSQNPAHHLRAHSIENFSLKPAEKSAAAVFFAYGHRQKPKTVHRVKLKKEKINKKRRITCRSGVINIANGAFSPFMKPHEKKNVKLA